MTPHEMIRAMEIDGALIDTDIEEGIHAITIIDSAWRMCRLESPFRFDWERAYEEYQRRQDAPGGRRSRQGSRAAKVRSAA